MLKALIETSIFVLLISKLWNGYCSICRYLGNVYDESNLCKAINSFWMEIRICFRYSFLGGIMQLVEQGDLVALDVSRTMQWIINLWKKCSHRFIQGLNKSRAIGLIKEINKNAYLSPVKVGSIIIISAIIANLALLLIANKKIGLEGLVMRVLLLSVGLAGLFCKADWPAVESSSLILKRIAK